MYQTPDFVNMSKELTQQLLCVCIESFIELTFSVSTKIDLFQYDRVLRIINKGKIQSTDYWVP
jgi:hypothetical protein